MSSLRDLSVFFSCMVLLMVPSGHGSRIIGGKEVKPHSLPHMVLLRDNTQCGGTLIHPSWVLSAAHCGEYANVKLGVHSITAWEPDRQVIRTERQIRHPKFNTPEDDNDLMLIKLETPAKETETVKPLKLQETVKDPAGGTRCLVAGWGKTDPNSNAISDVLMSVNLYVIDRATCNSRKYWYKKITSNMVCAFRNGQKRVSTCKGDSGGPLLCNGVQVGVTSFGKSCGLRPGVYAFLSDTQLQWIKQTMEEYEM